MMTDHTKTAVDIVSITTVAGTLANILPSIAALFTIIWTVIRIYETRTVRKWLGRDACETTGDEP